MAMTKFPDYYSVINLPFGSSPDVIKKYYRELAKIFHPDNKTTGEVAEFQHLLAAYQVLSGEFREAYDKVYLKHLSLKANVDKPKQ
jgi:molecular chaperone DnaJ